MGIKDLVGVVFGRLTVQNRILVPNKKGVYWECSCECGGSKVVQAGKLHMGYTKSCGCLRSEMAITKSISRVKQLKGLIFGRLTVVGRAKGEHKEWYWNCVCACGNQKVMRGSRLTSGKTKSCGCLAREQLITHGMSHIPEFETWCGIKKRCCDPNNKAYKYYGARGVAVCGRWINDFEAFYIDMGERPTPKHSIERLDNEGDYEPSNCIWADQFMQARNRRVDHRNVTGCKGVVPTKSGKYRAQLHFKGRNICLGTYGVLEDAIMARKAGELEYWG